jgi:septal ring factor EnvC (AmiA/AmiB activator)
VESAKPTKLIRELNPAEKEKLENAERLIAAEHNRAQELEKELKSLKIRIELGQRQLKTSHASSKLQKDKFRALEKRLNRTLLERDFVLRAMRDLENRCGLQAALPELPEEAFSPEDTENASEFSPNSEETEKTEA